MNLFEVFDNVKFDIDKMLKKSIILFGASKLGEEYYDWLSRLEFEITYFCDNSENKWGTYHCGKKVISPNELSRIYQDSFIVISSSYYSEIEMQLNNMGIFNILPFKSVEDIRSFVWRKNIDILFDKYAADNLIVNEDKINHVFEMLEDEISKETFAYTLKWRMFYSFLRDYNKLFFDMVDFSQRTKEYYDRKFSAINGVDKFQYFPEDIISISEKEVLIDVGAYDGDTIDSYIKFSKGRFKKIYAIEASEKNCDKIYEFLIRSEHSEKVEVINKAIADKSGKCIFSDLDSQGLGSGSYVESFDSVNNLLNDFCRETLTEVEMVSLDCIAKDWNPTFIKMDIEGAEIKAIQGANKIISKYTPKLAICIYHKDSDLWEIPILIKTINSNYKLFMRHHSKYYKYETVCYAI